MRVFNKQISLTLSLVILFQVIAPTYMMALTSGPSQPEYSSFQTLSSTENVDLFTGDFNYNIPLCNIPGSGGGYPLSLSYNSVTNVEEEASMIGLGWNINLGHITRSMRGLPDDFNGQRVKRKVDMKKDITASIKMKFEPEYFGFKPNSGGLTVAVSAMWNSYQGIGFSFSPSYGFKNPSLAGSLGLSFNSFDGLSYNGSIGGEIGKKDKVSSGTFGFSGNSIDGVQSLNYQRVISGSPLKLALGEKSTHTPSYDLAYEGVDVTIGFKPNIELFGFSGGVPLLGNYSEQVLRYKNRYEQSAAYGTMYLEKGIKKDYALLDFNRIKEKPIHDNVENLPYAHPTEDIFSLSTGGEGSGSFCFSRSDVGVFKDKEVVSHSAGFYAYGEFGQGAFLETGGDLTLKAGSTSNIPKKVTSLYNFQSINTDTKVDQGHFRFMSEMSAESPKLADEWTGIMQDYDHISKDDLIRYPLKKNSPFQRSEVLPGVMSSNSISSESLVLSSQSTGLHRSIRKPRSTAILSFNGDEILQPQDGCIVPYLDTKIYSGDPSLANHASEPTNTPTRMYDSRIEGFIAINPQGKRYVYGLPVINSVQKEVVVSYYNANDQSQNLPSSTLVDLILENGALKHKFSNDNILKGCNNYLKEETTPEYASSHLLTSILGDNYVDVDPTDGLPNDSDIGDWVRFDYIKSTDQFKWRFPFAGGQFNAGNHSLIEDNTISYSYGEKEVYYPFRVETDSHYALFYYEERRDAKSASSELQQIGSTQYGASSYRLSSIKVFTKGKPNANNQDVLEKEILLTQEYFGSNVPNSENGGKLFLTEVKINNYSSTRGELNPYKFSYHGEFSYAPNVSDRWGCLKPIEGSDESQNYFEPYALQTDQVNSNIKTFNLKEVYLPSGSKITVDIGRDHYGYVQDRVATNMVKIAGIGELGKNQIDNIGTDALNIFFKLADDLDGVSLNNYINDLYTNEEGKQVLFKLYSRLDDLDEDSYEYVLGAATLGNNNVRMHSDGIHGIITLSKVQDINLNLELFNYHPFLVANWQYLKINLRKLLLPSAPELPNQSEDLTGTDQILAVFNSLKESTLKKAFELFKQYYQRCFDAYGHYIDLDKSYIRLNSPNRFKYGGGVRVNSVLMQDIWDGDNHNPRYGKYYTYTKSLDTAGKILSSTGVASNEPEMGKEENALFFLEEYRKDLRFGTDYLYFELAPYNDNHLPGAVVGYEEVRVESVSGRHYNLSPPSQKEEVVSSGLVVNEYYTSKDFPTIFKNTDVEHFGYFPGLIPLPGIGQIQNQAFTGSQGYYCETNDMHGKSKKVTYYPQLKDGQYGENEVSSVEYIYSSKEENYFRGVELKSRKKLVNDNKRIVLDHDSNRTINAELGVTRNVYGDVRRINSTSGDAGLQVNVNAIVPLFVLPVPSVLPQIAVGISNTETAVLNKHISKKGIIEKVIATDGLSRIETSNEAFDPYTGSAVHTSVNNAFDDLLYNSGYPSYASHARMGPSYKNLEYTYGHLSECSDEANAQRSLLLTNYPVYLDPCSGYMAFNNRVSDLCFIPGDEVLLECYDAETNDKVGKTYGYFIKAHENCNVDGIYNYLFDFLDDSFIDNDCKRYTIKVIRSGNRNLLSAQSHSISSLKQPPAVESLNDMEQVLNVSSTIYSDKWHFDGLYEGTCNSSSNPVNTNPAISLGFNNPFHSGHLGIFRPEETYSYQTSRQNSSVNTKGIYNNAIGLLHTHDPGYVDNQGFGNWLRGDHITKYTSSHDVLETVNALDIYASRLKVNLQSNHHEGQAIQDAVLASAQNARYYETCNSSFEPYEYYQYDSQMNAGSPYNTVDASNNCNFHWYLGGQPLKTSCEEVYNHARITGTSIIIDKEYNPNKRFLNGHIDVYYSDHNGQDYSQFSSQIIGEDDDGNGKTLLTIANTNNCDNLLNPSPRVKVVIQRQQHAGYTATNPSISGEYAHTGKHALYVEANTPTQYNFANLDLMPNKKYFISCWAYIDDPVVANLEDAGVALSVGNVGQVDISAYGNRIEGWQQFRGWFEPKTNPNLQVLYVNFTPGGQAVYFDDFRIHPYEASMESYVYDAETYQLDYILDDNNYFTKYVYDGNGQLISIQKETERGVKSLQESRTYINPVDNE